MKVSFYANLRELTGGKTVDLPLPDHARAQDLIDVLIETYPPMKDELFDDQGILYPHVHVFINGRDVRTLEDEMETVLKPTDKLDIFPPVAGG